MLQYETVDVLFLEEQDYSRFLGHGRGRVGTIVENGHLSQGGACAFGMNGLLAPLGVDSVGPDAARHDDEESRSFVARQKQLFPAHELPLAGQGSQFRQLFGLETAE